MVQGRLPAIADAPAATHGRTGQKTVMTMSVVCLNAPVVEHWNGATDFIHFARRGEMFSNRREDHETSMLALHLIQNGMVYVNTLMLQEMLAQPHWRGRLTATDLRALTPLIWGHVNPYGCFELDMMTRLPLR